MVSKLRRHQSLLRNLVPDVVVNDLKLDSTTYSKGNLKVMSSRFKTRIQQNNPQQVRAQCVDSSDVMLTLHYHSVFKSL